jgi:hypothetical protein
VARLRKVVFVRLTRTDVRVFCEISTSRVP